MDGKSGEWSTPDIPPPGHAWRMPTSEQTVRTAASSAKQLHEPAPAGHPAVLAERPVQTPAPAPHPAPADPSVPAPHPAPAIQESAASAPRPSWRIPRRRGGYLDGATSAGTRLIGIDAARGLAILGMMVAHVGVTTAGIDTLEGWLAFSHGRASILFAVIAGFSLGLLSGGTRPHTGEKLLRSRLRILVRSALLMLVAALLQLLGTPVAIILGFYAAWFAFALPVLHWRPRRLFILAAATAIVGGAAKLYLPWLLASLGMDPMNIMNANGALVEFMLTGVYPGVVWMAFIFLGLGLSRIQWDSARRLAALLAAGVVMAAAGHVGAYFLAGWLNPEHQPVWSLTEEGAGFGSGAEEWILTDDDMRYIEQDIVDGYLSIEEAEQFLDEAELAQVSDGMIDGVPLTPSPGSPNGEPLADGEAPVFGPDSMSGAIPEEDWGYYEPATGPGWHSIPAPSPTDLITATAHSGTPFEAVGNGGVAVAIIAAFGLIARRAAWLLAPLATVGAMSLTIYSAHIVAIWAADPFGGGMGASDNTYLAWMVAISIAFAMAWRLIWARGPLEHAMHVISVRTTLPPKGSAGADPAPLR